jgi:DNA-binding NarL/FixJ family response regulator
VPESRSVIRLAVVDPYPVFALGLRASLDAFAGIEVVGCWQTVADAAASIGHSDAVLVGTALDDDDVDAIRQARALTDRPIVAAVHAATEEGIRAVFAAGADGFLLRDSRLSIWVWAIEAAVDGGKPLDPRATMALFGVRPRLVERPGTLTPREQEVLEMLSQGLSNKHIARRMGVAERTVKAHLTRIYACMGVQNRTQAAQRATEQQAAGRA